MGLINLARHYHREAARCGIAAPWRYFFRWSRSLKNGATTVSERVPWITFAAIDKMNAYLQPGHKVFEYGGGGSTLFFADRVSQLVTVEHNPQWFETLSGIMRTFSGHCKWHGELIKADKGDISAQADPSNPSHYSSGDEPSKGFNYRQYVQFIDRYPENSFDVVLVDGRSRPSCIIHCYPRLKSGGWLVLDNSDRAYYLAQTREILNGMDKVLDNFGPGPLSMDFTKTSIWRKK